MQIELESGTTQPARIGSHIEWLSRWRSGILFVLAGFFVVLALFMVPQLLKGGYSNGVLVEAIVVAATVVGAFGLGHVSGSQRATRDAPEPGLADRLRLQLDEALLRADSARLHADSLRRALDAVARHDEMTAMASQVDER